MSLPTLNTPTYELVIPSSKKKIKYRPFVVKEEKLLLLALESEDDAQIAEAIKNIINACVLTKGVDVEKLASFDIEYIFINIRGKSVGEVIDLMFTCPDDGETQVKVSVKIDDIKVDFPEDHTNQIKVSDNLWVEMKYPTIDTLAMQEDDVEDTFKIVASSIAKIYNDEDVWDENTTTKEEFVEFVEQMSSKQFAEIQKFFDTMPSLRHKIDIKNPKTKVVTPYTIEGLSNFFA